jgi:hypothetical protein
MLRGLVLATTSLWIGALLAPHASGFEWGSIMWFSLLYAALFHVELLGSSLRRKHRGSAETAGVVFSLIATALLSAALLRIFWTGNPWLRGTWLLTFAAIATVISILNRHALPKLSISYRVQAAALVLVTVPIVFTGAGISFGWAILALALAALGGFLDDHTARIASVASWFLALANLILWSTSSHPAAAQHVGFSIWHQAIPMWALYAAIIGLSGHILAVLLGINLPVKTPDGIELSRLISGMSFCASAVYAMTAIIVLPPFGATASLLIYAWLCVALERTTDRFAFGIQAWALVLFTVAKWAAIDTLAAQWSSGWSPATYRPLLNPLMLTAVGLAGSLLGMYRLAPGGLDHQFRGSSERAPARPIALAAALVILWAGTLEIGRAVSAGIFPGSALWPHFALTQVAWTSWWMIGAIAYLAYATWMDPREIAASKLLQAVALMPILLGIKFLTLDTVLAHGLRVVPATVLFNAQAATGAVALAGLLLLRRMLPETGRLRFIAGAVAVLVPLLCGTLEIDRAFDYSPALAALFADRGLAKLVAFSIFFSLYASAAVALGFVVRSAGLRYFGLALFALTLAKVGLLDLSHASTGYRFLSFIGLGALLLVTSVLYGRLSPKLLRASEATT